MDANKTLKLITTLITRANSDKVDADANWKEAFFQMESLFMFLKEGGAAPNVPQGTYICLGDGGLASYSLLSIPEKNGGGATFIRYQFSKTSGQMEETHKYGCPAVQHA